MNNYTSAIRQLRAEKARIEYLIIQLERLWFYGPAIATPNKRRRRGRKTMPEDERLEVSARMRRYWASRKKGSVSEGEAGD